MFVLGKMHRANGRTGVPGTLGPLLALGVLALGLGGCTVDSFLDPSVVGRWERTPTVVPVLERIEAIEGESGEFIEFTEVTLEDLRPESEEYRISPGDVLRVGVFDLIIRGELSSEDVSVDANGYIEFVQLGRLQVGGLTAAQATEVVRARAAQFVVEPDVLVQPQVRREQSYTLVGAVASPGRYGIPSADFRLLEATAQSGGVSESIPYIYVIRQVVLSPDLERRSAPPPTGGADAKVEIPGGPLDLPGAGGSGSGVEIMPERPSADDLIDLIDDLSGDGQPGVFASGRQVAQPLIDLDGSSGGQPASAQEPLVDLPGGAPAGAPTGAAAPRGGWVFLDGRWVRTGQPLTPPGGSSGDGVDDAAPLVTQRVIRVPVRSLLEGDARYNLVVRPGDVLRVPPPTQGNVYIDGQVVRPGVYTLPPLGRLTLQRAITAAGGLGGLAIPERCDLTRMVGPDRQATIMLNLRAIGQGTQPDVFLKPDDRINIGTNFWAFPLAVIRGGFRTSYGFGFLLDRNFGNDVFGPPPLAQPGG